MTKRTPNERRRLLIGSIVTALGTSSGCLSAVRSPPVDMVQLSIMDVRNPNLGVTTVTIPIILHLENESNVTIPSPKVKFDVTIDGTEVGATETTFTSLKSTESRNERISVLLDYTEVGQSLVSSVGRGSFTVVIRGTIESNGATKEIESRYEAQ